MIVFQVSLNFVPMKEILKIQCQIYTDTGGPNLVTVRMEYLFAFQF